ncbi:MAG: hypothetical protein KDD62_06510, partial [Bdellovibrionales bacterium]|nr:hypothetical protein [Bdellovibrionales bacterium]
GPQIRSLGALMNYAQGEALLDGRSFVKGQDIHNVAFQVLQHRIHLDDTYDVNRNKEVSRIINLMLEKHVSLKD